MDDSRIIERISALMSKTEDAGATEDEALAAAEKARELIDKHQIDIRKVAAHSEKAGRRIGSDERVFQPALRKFRFHEIHRLFGNLGKYCDVVILTVNSPPGHADLLTIVGEPLDCRMAFFMISNLRAAVDQSHEIAVRQRKLPSSVKARTAYMRGAVAALGVRLSAMASERERKHKTNGTDLVALKRSDVRAECERLFPDARTKTLRPTPASPAIMKGYQDGKEIPIQQGVEANKQHPALT